MNYEKIRLRGSQFRSVTSLEVSEFDELLTDFSFYMDRSLRYTTRGKIRRNKLVLPPSLPDFGHLLFFVLTYLKLNPLQEQQGAIFDLSQESVSRWYRICLAALNSALKKQGDMPIRTGGDFADWVKKKEGVGENYFIDASGMKVQRAGSNEEQEYHYSGKHHRHEVKNTYVSDEKSSILYLGPTWHGSIHDKKMAEEEEIIFPDDCFLWKDLGYQGYLPDNVNCFEPYKKPKNKELDKWQKIENKAIASVRIVVEHAIGGVKRCRIMKDTIRLHGLGIRDRVIETCTALHNFRLRFRPIYKVNQLFNP